MKKEHFCGTFRLFKNSLKQNICLSVLLIVLPFLVSFGVAASNITVLNTPAALQSYIVQNQGNPLLGNIAGTTIEAASIWRVRTSAAVLIFILNIVLVISMTRNEEDLGRLELIRSGAIGGLAPLSAALLKVFGLNLIGGIGMTAGFLMVSFPAAGSIVSGMSIALGACAIAAVSAVFAQLAPDARLARGLSLGTIAILLAVNVAANITDSRLLLMCTPFGWCSAAGPYVAEKPSIFIIAIAIIAALLALVYGLAGKRDVGRGYLPEWKGRASGGKHFHTPFALAWRLQRGTVFAWIAAYALMGIVIASLAPKINGMLGASSFAPELASVMGGSGSAFLAILSYILTQVITAFSLMSVLRLREEEALNRTELILSAPVSRVQYVCGHYLIAYLGSAAAIMVFGLLTGDFYSCILRIPAVWVVTSIAALFLGTAPRAAAAAGWGVFGLLLAIEFLWEMRFISNTLFRISPFSWVYPGQEVSALSIMIMLLISVFLLICGFAGWKRRNIAAGR